MNHNDHLRYERRLRGWSQARVAEQIGTDAGNVSRWERGFSSPSPYYQERLCLLFDKEAQDLGFLVENAERSSPQSMEEPLPLSEVSQEKPSEVEFPSHELRVLASVSYLLGWFTGLPVLFFLNKNRFVLFHSLQSLFLFGWVIVLYGVFIGLIFIISPDIVRVIVSFLFIAMNIVIFVAWIVGMATAMMGKYYKLPFIGNLCEKIITAFQR